MSKSPSRVAIFASGSGSNAEKIIQYAQHTDSFQVSMVVASRSTAGVLTRADRHHIPYCVLSKSEFYSEPQSILDRLENIDFIILAGFLWLIPPYLIQAYDQKILNIHPSLLPHYGGAGMYGKHVHAAVYNAHEEYSGITIHVVNEEYDKGRKVFQARTPIDHCNDPLEVATVVQSLEHKYFPFVIESYVQS